MRTRLRLGALTLLSSVLTAVLALAACDAAGRLASAPPSAWGPTALTRALVLMACGAGALGAAWHALSGALAVIALAGPAPSARGAGVRRAALRALHRWGAPIMRRTAAGALVAAVAAGAPAMAAQAPGASDDLGWAPTASAPAPAGAAPSPDPDAARRRRGSASRGSIGRGSAGRGDAERARDHPSGQRRGVAVVDHGGAPRRRSRGGPDGSGVGRTVRAGPDRAGVADPVRGQRREHRRRSRPHPPGDRPERARGPSEPAVPPLTRRPASERRPP